MRKMFLICALLVITFGVYNPLCRFDMFLSPELLLVSNVKEQDNRNPNINPGYFTRLLGVIFSNVSEVRRDVALKMFLQLKGENRNALSLGLVISDVNSNLFFQGWYAQSGTNTPGLDMSYGSLVSQMELGLTRLLNMEQDLLGGRDPFYDCLTERMSGLMAKLVNLKQAFFSA